MLRVYIVEDSPILARLFASAIESAGAAVVGSSGDAGTAIVELPKLRPDLIIIDISLKSGTGFDVLRSLRNVERRPKSVKVVLTNHASDEYKELSTQLGADRFFDKSYQTAQALAFIEDVAKARNASAQPA